MRQADFNGLDSSIEPTTRHKKKSKNIQPSLIEGTIIDLSGYFGINRIAPGTDTGLMYSVIGVRYRKNSGKRVYALQPNLLGDTQRPHIGEVEDSVKLFVWNEQKQKWQTRTEYAESLSGDEKTA